MSHKSQEPSDPPDGADSAGESGGSSSSSSAESAAQRVADRNVTRIFTGGDGREWTVRELPPPSYDRRRGPSLLFSADDVWRRVRRYPADWHQRPDAELYEISLGV